MKLGFRKIMTGFLVGLFLVLFSGVGEVRANTAWGTNMCEGLYDDGSLYGMSRWLTWDSDSYILGLRTNEKIGTINTCKQSMEDKNYGKKSSVNVHFEVRNSKTAKGVASFLQFLNIKDDAAGMQYNITLDDRIGKSFAISGKFMCGGQAGAAYNLCSVAKSVNYKPNARCVCTIENGRITSPIFGSVPILSTVSDLLELETFTDGTNGVYDMNMSLKADGGRLFIPASNPLSGDNNGEPIDLIEDLDLEMFFKVEGILYGVTISANTNGFTEELPTIPERLIFKVSHNKVVVPPGKDVKIGVNLVNQFGMMVEANGIIKELLEKQVAGKIGYKSIKNTGSSSYESVFGFTEKSLGVHSFSLNGEKSDTVTIIVAKPDCERDDKGNSIPDYDNNSCCTEKDVKNNDSNCVNSDANLNGKAYKSKEYNKVDLSGVNPLSTGIGGIENIKDFIVALTNNLVRLSTAIAVTCLVLAGFMYLRAGGDEAKATKAKGMITSIVWALMLIFMSYIIISLLQALIYAVK